MRDKTQYSWNFTKYLALFCMVIPIIPPEGVSHLYARLYSIVWVYGRYAMDVWISALFVSRLYRRGAKKSYLLFFFMIVSTLIISILKGASINEWFNIFGNAFIMYMFFCFFSNHIPQMLRTVNAWLKLLILLNLICILAFPTGMYVSEGTGYKLNWILGYKSSFQYYIYPCVVISWIEYEYKKISNLSLGTIIVVCLFEAIKGGNLMLSISVSVISLVCIIGLEKLTMFFNPVVYYILIILENIAVIFSITKLVSSSLGAYFLTITGKGDTLGGRITRIWPITIKYIRNSPITGYGVLTPVAHRRIYNMYAAIHAHNQLLEIMFTGGFVFLILYLLWLLTVFADIKKNVDIQTARIIGFSIFILFQMLLLEVYTRPIAGCIWLIFFMASRTKEIDEQYLSEIGRKKNYKIIGRRH